MSVSRWRLFESLVLGTVLLFLALLVLPVDAEGVRESRRAGCRHRLHQIGLALHAYHTRYGSFPPAFVTDDNGRPVHSWRTLILPFLGQKTLYNSIWLSEPWDERRNVGVLSRLQSSPSMPYGCPESADGSHPALSPWNGTNYLAITGADTAWPDDRPARLSDDFPDGAGRTILVVEVEHSDIAWTEPRDIPFSEMNFTANAGRDRLISSPWSSRSPIVHVLFADGSVRTLPADTPAETIRALITRNGGETVVLD
jgi:prepilin-type processing-associated H-X9-DG protein